jgi:osmotically-inducible protein OsmY
VARRYRYEGGSVVNVEKTITLLGGICAAATWLSATSAPVWATPTHPAVTDGQITLAVEDELVPDRGVSPNFVDVKTAAGIVTLSGSVDNILAKERAVKIAESIRGVRGVIDVIGVTPVLRSDEDLRRDILTALQQDPATESYKIDVNVKNALVTLKGSVGSWTEVRLASWVAKRVRGVEQLDNQLRISYVDKRTDAEMAADIKARIQWDIWINNSLIAAEVMSGKVKLRGSVGSVLEKSRASDDAWVNGVTSVDATAVNVEPWMRRDLQRERTFVTKSDGEIKNAVEAALRYDPRVSGFSLDVKVEDEIVTLSGSVGNLKAKIAAEQDAKDTVGSTWVRNLLKVRPDSLPTDAAIEKTLKAALHRDSILDGSAITAVAIHHVVYLSGSVDWGYQKQEAYDVAARTKGVLEVRNRLATDPGYGMSYYDWPTFEYEFGLLQPRKSDEQIKKDIEKALRWSPFVDSDDVVVTVSDGVATLSGTVGTWIGYDEAQRGAKKSGASEVINKLDVRRGAWF